MGMIAKQVIVAVVAFLILNFGLKADNDLVGVLSFIVALAVLVFGLRYVRRKA